MKNYTTCVFDLDGTLINSLDDLADCCNEALELFELPCHSVDEYRMFVGSGIVNLIKRAMGKKSSDQTLVKAVYNTFNILYEEKCLYKTKPYEGIPQLLAELKRNDIKIGILSNKSDEFANRIVEALFEHGEPDVVWGKKKEFPIKPEPQALYAIMDELHTDRESCLYIGDSDVDVKTAKNANVDFCGVEWGFRGISELLGAGAAFIADTPSDILDLVLGNEQNELSKGA